MKLSLLNIFEILGALGFFIYGMKVMSEGIQKVAGEQMRQVLSTIASNRFVGVFIGFLLTSVVQSSSATTVMIVSFVNAELLSLTESIGIIMGANIGTTVTAWLISIFGFKVKIITFTLPIIAIGFPMLFSSNNAIKSWAEVLIGFALLFMGLDALKSHMPDLTENQLNFLNEYTDLGRISVLFFVFIGTIITILVQSSSASMALTFVLCNQGVIPFEIAAAMILGENIGTTITANLSALVASTEAKQTARAHFIFNTVGVTWMIIVFPFFTNLIKTYTPFLVAIVEDSITNLYNTPVLGTENYTIILFALSIFHTSFNLINTLLLIGFVPYIAKLAKKMTRGDKQKDREFQIDFIGNTFFNTLSEVSLLEAKKEITKFGKIIQKMSFNAQKAINEVNKKTRKKNLAKIKAYEILTDKLEIAIANFLTKTSQDNLSIHSSTDIRAMLSTINNLERIGDLFKGIALIITKKYEEKLWFSNPQKERLNNMFEKVHHALTIMLENLDSVYHQVDKSKAVQAEEDINILRNQLKREYLNLIQQKQTEDLKTAMAYYDICSTCERIGDHIINITEGIIGEI